MVPKIPEQRHTAREKINSIGQSRNQITMPREHRAEAQAREQNTPERGLCHGQAMANWQPQ